jgi:hypothetical protein
MLQCPDLERRRVNYRMSDKRNERRLRKLIVVGTLPFYTTQPSFEGYCLLACDTVQSGRILHMFWSEIWRPFLSTLLTACSFVCFAYSSTLQEGGSSTRLHGMPFQKIVLFIVTSARISQPCLECGVSSFKTVRESRSSRRDHVTYWDVSSFLGEGFKFCRTAEFIRLKHLAEGKSGRLLTPIWLRSSRFRFQVLNPFLDSFRLQFFNGFGYLFLCFLLTFWIHWSYISGFRAITILFLILLIF